MVALIFWKSVAKPELGQAMASSHPDDVPQSARVLPSYDELPTFHELKGCAWELWGKDDELGTVNLLTESVVQRAAREEIR